MSDVTGTLSGPDPAHPQWGEVISFTATHTGRLRPTDAVYVRVTIQQAGKGVVYDWSQQAGFNFPLDQQGGFAALNPPKMIDKGISGQGTAELVHRAEKGKGFVFNTLASVAFTVEP